jgi:hypothetical protein
MLDAAAAKQRLKLTGAVILVFRASSFLKTGRQLSLIARPAEAMTHNGSFLRGNASQPVLRVR